jgi:hypothetical protein
VAHQQAVPEHPVGHVAVGAGPLDGLEETALRAAFDGKFFAYVTILKAALPKLRDDASVTVISAASARSPAKRAGLRSLPSRPVCGPAGRPVRRTLVAGDRRYGRGGRG